MKLSTKQLGGVLGATVFTVGGLGLLATPGCEDNPIADACNLDCGEGFAKGQFSITGTQFPHGKERN